MKLVISRKRNVVNTAAEQPIDAASIMNSVNTPGTTYRFFHENEDPSTYISQRTIAGFVCHTFNYEGTAVASTSVTNFRVA